MFAMIEDEVILTFWHYSIDEKEKKRERKKSTRANINCEAAKKNDGGSLTI